MNGSFLNPMTAAGYLEALSGNPNLIQRLQAGHQILRELGHFQLAATVRSSIEFTDRTCQLLDVLHTSSARLQDKLLAVQTSHQELTEQVAVLTSTARTAEACMQMQREAAMRNREEQQLLRQKCAQLELKLEWCQRLHVAPEPRSPTPPPPPQQQQQQAANFVDLLLLDDMPAEEAVEDPPLNESASLFRWVDDRERREAELSREIEALVAAALPDVADVAVGDYVRFGIDDDDSAIFMGDGDFDAMRLPDPHANDEFHIPFEAELRRAWAMPPLIDAEPEVEVEPQVEMQVEQHVEQQQQQQVDETAAVGAIEVEQLQQQQPEEAEGACGGPLPPQPVTSAGPQPDEDGRSSAECSCPPDEHLEDFYRCPEEMDNYDMYLAALNNPSNWHRMIIEDVMAGPLPEAEHVHALDVGAGVYAKREVRMAQLAETETKRQQEHRQRRVQHRRQRQQQQHAEQLQLELLLQEERGEAEVAANNANNAVEEEEVAVADVAAAVGAHFVAPPDGDEGAHGGDDDSDEELAGFGAAKGAELSGIWGEYMPGTSEKVRTSTPVADTFDGDFWWGVDSSMVEPEGDLGFRAGEVI